MGARVEVPGSRAIVSYYRRAALNVTTGEWAVALDPPPFRGTFDLVWRTDDAEPPELEVIVPLVIT